MNNFKQVNIQYLPTDEEIDSSKQLKAGKFLWPGFTHNYPVFARQLSGGKYRYQTGLSAKDAPEDKRAEIEQAVKDIEDYYGEGTLDPFNHSFWKDIQLVMNKKNVFLDIQNNMEHKLLYYVIKAGGIFEVAPSYEEAIASATQKRWYLIEPEEFAELSAVSDRTINKAIANLTILDEEKSFDDMFLIHKFLISAERGVTKQTPKSTLYKDLSEFIHGKLVKTEKRKTPKQFIDAFDLLKKDKKKLYVSAYVKDANYFNFLTVNEDNSFQNIQTKTKYGSTIDKAVEFLSNPANQTELENVKERVESKWKE